MESREVQCPELTRNASLDKTRCPAEALWPRGRGQGGARALRAGAGGGARPCPAPRGRSRRPEAGQRNGRCGRRPGTRGRRLRPQVPRRALCPSRGYQNSRAGNSGFWAALNSQFPTPRLPGRRVAPWGRPKSGAESPRGQTAKSLGLWQDRSPRCPGQAASGTRRPRASERSPPAIGRAGRGAPGPCPPGSSETPGPGSDDSEPAKRRGSRGSVQVRVPGPLPPG